jgi:hypothetical protein
MIVPVVGIKYYNFNPPVIGEVYKLIKEKDNLYDPMAIAVYNNAEQVVGYIGARSQYNLKIYKRILQDSVNGIVWCICKNQILVEVDLPRF